MLHLVSKSFHTHQAILYHFWGAFDRDVAALNFAHLSKNVRRKIFHDSLIVIGINTMKVQMLLDEKLVCSQVP